MRQCFHQRLPAFSTTTINKAPVPKWRTNPLNQSTNIHKQVSSEVSLMSPEEIQNQTAEQFHNSDSKLSPKKGRGARTHVEGDRQRASPTRKKARAGRSGNAIYVNKNSLRRVRHPDLQVERGEGREGRGRETDAVTGIIQRKMRNPRQNLKILIYSYYAFF